MEWYIKCLRQYADFSGRARRREYWMFYLFNLLVSLCLGLVAGFLGVLLDADLTFLVWIYTLVVLLPSLAVCVRRLHDVGKSGWMYLIALIPIIGTIWLIVLLCTDGESGANKWGVNPKE